MGPMDSTLSSSPETKECNPLAHYRKRAFGKLKTVYEVEIITPELTTCSFLLHIVNKYTAGYVFCRKPILEQNARGNI